MIHDRAIIQCESVVRVTAQVNGKAQNLPPPCHALTP